MHQQMISLIALMIIILPLASAIVNGILSRVLSKRYVSIIATFAMALSALCATIIFYHTGLNQHIIHITLFPWIDIEQYANFTPKLNFLSFKVNWAIYIDQLTAIMFLVVTWVSSVVHIYSLGYMAEDKGINRFLAFLSLFTSFMLILVSSDNFLQLFFGWEGVGVCSYLLVGFWYQKDSANKAAVKAFIANRVGDFAFILGIITIITYTHSANFKDVFLAAKELADIKVTLLSCEVSILDIICLLLFIGCMGKSAQIGLHIWLPDAMEGPTPVSALIHAATMVTAGVFLVARCSYMFEYSPIVLQFITIIGGVTCLFAATIAIMLTDIKKIIAYSTCSQLGYMFLACGVSAYDCAVFHLATHAFFKSLLFLSAGSVIHAIEEQNIYKMGGLRNKMPVTYGNFLVGSLALTGIYPFAGFYSKDSILDSAYNAGGLGSFMFIFGVIAVGFTALYSMKIIVLAFHGKTRMTAEAFKHAHEPPKIMNIPLILLVAGSLFNGMIGYYLLSMDKPNGYFHDSLFYLHVYKLLAHPPLIIKLLPMMFGIAGMIIGVYIYRKTKETKNFSFIGKILYNKYYFDEIYAKLIVQPFNCLARLFYFSDQKIIDRFGPGGFSQIVNCFSVLTSRTHTGFVFNYTLFIAIFVVVSITYFMWIVI